MRQAVPQKSLSQATRSFEWRQHQIMFLMVVGLLTGTSINRSKKWTKH